MKFAEKIRIFIEKNNLLDIQLPVLVAVSGGVDSVVLLDVLVDLGYKCSVAHCNFHLRGQDSDTDEIFVKNIAKKYAIPLYIRHFDTVGEAKKSRQSIEMTARNLRYEWFDLLVKEFDFQAVAVAHHKNDLAETVLLNIVRGTGIRGISALKPKRDKIVRPFLCVTRSEIESYAAEKKLDFRIDCTNSDVEIVRNRLRHNVLPEMQKINSAVVEKICQFSEFASDAQKIYDYALQQIEKNICFEKNSLKHIDIQQLKKSPAPKTVLFEILKNYGFNSDIIENIYKNLDLQSGKIFLSERYKIIKDRDFLILSKIENIDSQQFTIAENISFIKKPIEINFEILDKKDIASLKMPENIALLDFEKLKFPLILRHWQIGDSFKPLGSNGVKKISDFFINQHISIAEKEKIWLLFSDEKLVWVVNYRIDDRFKIDKKTTKILKLTTKNL